MSTKRPASPTQSNKKPCIEVAPAATTAGAQMSRGQMWIVQEIDKALRQYEECMRAQIAILHYQTHAKRLSSKSRRVPRQMINKRDAAWTAHETTRRRIDWYMSQNALYTSSTSSSSDQAHVVPPTRSQAKSRTANPKHLELAAPNQPKASPIPLAAASMLAYDTSNAKQQSIGSKPNSNLDTNPNAMSSIISGSNFPEGSIPMELSSLGISELHDIINGNNIFNAGPSNGGANIGSTERTAMFGGGNMNMTEMPRPNTDGANREETEKLFASLTAMGNGPTDTQRQQAQAQAIAPAVHGSIEAGSNQSGQQAEPDVDAILASLNSTSQSTEQPPAPQARGAEAKLDAGEFNFDFGGDNVDVDLSELAGLFSENNSGAATIQPTPASTTTGKDQGGAEAVNQGQSAAGTQGKEDDSQMQSQQGSASANIEGLEGLGNMGGEEYDFGGIDLDDFNFGDENLPNVDGDEFESLFAEFK